MNSDAEYLSPEAQVERLKARGLEFLDEAEALRMLPNIGYHRLNSYLRRFESSGKDLKRTCAGVRFEDVMRVYRFDLQLRSLMLAGLEGVEVAVRSMWMDELSKHYGKYAYLNPSIFKDKKAHKQSLKKLQRTAEASYSLHPDVCHWRKSHPASSPLPFGMVISLMTFGELLRWIRNTKATSCRIQVARRLGFPTIRIMMGVLCSLVMVRNCCAHHERLWDRRIRTALPNIRKGLKRPLRTVYVASALEADRRLYNYILMLSHLTQRLTPDRAWTARMITLLSELPRKQLRIMGFPDDVSYTDI